VVFIDIKPRRILAPFTARVIVNPTFEGSRVVVYGYDSGVPESIEKIIKGLETRFGFSRGAPLSSAQGGSCEPTESERANAKQARDAVERGR
jgi:hypothetical protein